VIDLFADAPVGNPKASAYLLAAYAEWFAVGTVFLCVVDPGVGGARPAIILEADRRWYVGPGNGLFELVQRRATNTRTWDIDWQPEHLSASFHGRDLFAPVAAILARGEPPHGRPRKDDTHRQTDWPDDLPKVVYIDHFGNAIARIASEHQERVICRWPSLRRMMSPFWEKPPAIPLPLTAATSTRDIFVRRVVVACLEKIQRDQV
jgi:S-adenosylmethionine hydrolase